MEFGDDHYSRDWDLLAGIAREWALIREQFGLGSKATREQIEAVWDPIFNANQHDWPDIRRAHDHLMQDAALVWHLRKCYWTRLEASERKGYTFEEARPVVVTQIVFTVVRNAHAWLKRRHELEHWARFWNTKNLTEELRRAIKDMDKSEGSHGVQPPPDPDDDEPEGSHEPDVDYKGKRPEDPAEWAALKERMLGFCESQQEKDLIDDWFDSAREDSDKEQDVIGRHGVTLVELNALLRRIAKRIRDDNKH